MTKLVASFALLCTLLAGTVAFAQTPAPTPFNFHDCNAYGDRQVEKIWMNIYSDGRWSVIEFCFGVADGGVWGGRHILTDVRGSSITPRGVSAFDVRTPNWNIQYRGDPNTGIGAITFTGLGTDKLAAATEALGGQLATGGQFQATGNFGLTYSLGYFPNGRGGIEAHLLVMDGDGNILNARYPAIFEQVACFAVAPVNPPPITTLPLPPPPPPVER